MPNLPPGALSHVVMYVFDFPMMKDFRVLMERRYLQKLMQLSHGSKKEACRLSGLSRTRLFELLKKYKIGA